MIIPIVNQQDEIIGNKDRSDIDYDNDIFRTASLWITNSAGDVLLAQRKFSKKVDPGKWSEAVGGTVEGNESYLTTVIREAAEELGLNNIKIQPGPKQYISTSYKCFVQWYTIILDIPIFEFVIQDDEVEQIAWVPVEQLRSELKTNPDKYIDIMPDILQLSS